MSTPHFGGPPTQAPPASPRSITTGARSPGRTALSGLRSTEGFSQAGLPLPGRALILFLLVVLVDEQEKLTGAYQALLTGAARREGHWAHGLDLCALRKRCGKFLGKSAERVPTWDKIEDLLRAWQSPDTVEAVLADAAGLFCRVSGIPRPHSDYTGEISVPVWADSRVITVDMIRHALTQQRPSLPAPRAAAVGTSSPACPGPRTGEDVPAAKDTAGRTTIPAPAGPPLAEYSPPPTPYPAPVEPLKLHGVRWRRRPHRLAAPVPPRSAYDQVSDLYLPVYDQVPDPYLSAFYDLPPMYEHVPDSGSFTGQLDLPVDEDPVKLRAMLRSTITAFRAINDRLEQAEKAQARTLREMWEHREQRGKLTADVRKLMSYSIVLLKRLHPNTPDDIIGELFQNETGLDAGFTIRKVDQSG